MPHIPRIVCEPCNREMRPLLNGLTAEAMTSGRPYYKIECDRWQCEKCGRTVLTGFALEPFAVHHEADYYMNDALNPAAVRYVFNSEPVEAVTP